MIVKGIKHNKGSFVDRRTGNQIDYENYMLYGLDDNNEWTHEKISAKKLVEAGIYDANILIENKIKIYYNRFGSVDEIKIA